MTDSTPENFKAHVDAGAARARERRVALAKWSAIPKHERKGLGLAATDTQFAREWNVHVNTLGKDRKSPDYLEAFAEAEQVRSESMDARGTVRIAEATDFGNDDLAVYQQLKSQLATEALTGDQKALDTWLRTFGQPFIKEETSRVTAVASLTDRELIDEVLDLADGTLLATVLRERGWKREL